MVWAWESFLRIAVAANAADAAEALGITATRLKSLGLVEEIIPEPLGGAHRDYQLSANNVKQALVGQLNKMKNKPIDELVENRYQRYMGFGNFETA